MHGPHLPLGPGQSPAGQDPPPETGPFPAHGADLPAAELGNLPAIARSLSEASVFQRERLVHQLSAPGYLGRLVGLFRVCEDLEEEESLAQLHVALRAAIMLNDAGLIEALLSEPLVMDVVGALEYEPGVAPAARPRHREWLRDRAHLREPVPIADPGVRAKIHDTYRLGYVRDVVMPRFLDDAVLATLRSLALFNSVEVLMALAADAHAFPALFDKLRGAKPGGGDWADGVGFLQELASLAKHLQASQRTTLFGKLADLGLFEVGVQGGGGVLEVCRCCGRVAASRSPRHAGRPSRRGKTPRSCTGSIRMPARMQCPSPHPLTILQLPPTSIAAPTLAPRRS